MNNSKIILGIDPGTNAMGYGVISCAGSRVSLLSLGVIKLDKQPNQPMKLKAIFEQVSTLMENYQPDEVALEAPFFGENVQSMLKLGRAQGVAMVAALIKNVPIVEYAPRKVKMSIAGNGNASKEQVAAMLKNLLHMTELPKSLDATDGLAVAYCHFMQNGMSRNAVAKKSSGWAGFIKDNPERLR